MVLLVNMILLLFLMWLLSSDSYAEAFILAARQLRRGAPSFLVYSGGREREETGKIDVSALLRSCQRRNDYAEALAFANDLETKQDLTAMTATTIIRVYGEARQLGKAISVLQRMKSCGIQANERHYGALIHAARKAGQWEMAIGLFERMGAEGIKANTIVYNSMISTFGDAQRLDLVDEYLEMMAKEGVKKDTYTYSAAITACERSLEWKKALDLFENMEGEGVEANVVVLNSVLNACVKGRKWRMAMDLLARSRGMGIRPDTISYSSVITALGDAGRVDVALRLFNDMDTDGGTALLSQFAEKMQSMKPASLKGRGGNNRSIKTYEKQGQGQEEGQIQSRDQRSPAPWGPVAKDTGAYNAAITACERNGEPVKALNLLRRMLDTDSGVRPDGRSFSAAIAACGNAGEWKQALGLFNLMEQTGVARDTVVYNTIIAALQQAGQFSQAKDIEGEYPSAGASADAEVGGDATRSGTAAAASRKIGATMRYSRSLVARRSEGEGQKEAPSTPATAAAAAAAASASASASVAAAAGNAPALQQMPRYAQELYIQGLSEGMLKHWGRGDGEEGAGAGAGAGAGDGAGDGDGDGSAGASLNEATELLYWWQDVVNSELLPAGQRALESGSIAEMREVLDKLNFESFKLGRLDEDAGGGGGGGADTDGAGEGGGQKAYKEMDLHGFPLSVAQAAIDFVFSEIADGAVNAGTVVPGGANDGGTTNFDIDKALDSVTFDLKIVTGRGKHTNSSGTRGVLRGELETYLLSGVRPAGRLAVTMVSGNDGVLVVPRSSVRIWLRARLEQRLNLNLDKLDGNSNAGGAVGRQGGGSASDRPEELQ